MSGTGGGKGSSNPVMGRVLPLPDPEQMPRAKLAELIERASAGDVGAFERLVAAHQAKLYTFAFAFTGDADAAKDLTQDALVKVYRALASFRFQSAFSTWLYAIVRNAYLDHRKSRAARERGSEAPLDETALAMLRDEATAEDQMLAAESRRALLAAVRGLDEPFRSVVMMADVQGMDLGEIAGVLGAPVGTIKSRLARGRMALRVRLFGTADQAKWEEDP